MSRLAQGMRLAHVLTKPGAMKSFVTTRPFSTSAFLMAHDLRRGCGDLSTVIDVGANAGQFTRAMAREFPAARIVAVEPLPDVAARLRHNTRRLPLVRTVQCAAGSGPGNATMHRHAYSLSSSLLPTTGAFAREFPEAASAGPQTLVQVEVRRLDDLVDEADLADGQVLLKLDVQGYEIEALRGATTLLDKCDFVLVEAALEEVYAGEPLFDDLYAHLRARGFVLDRPIDVLRGAQGRISQMDVLFRRGPVA